jgi:Mn-dependent DtxR family transcriptional regulator
LKKAKDISFTEKQGQYLAFIFYYTKVNGRPPAEADMQRYFKVTPPTVNQMVKKLESLGLIQRTPGIGRSIELLISADEVPNLQ